MARWCRQWQATSLRLPRSLSFSLDHSLLHHLQLVQNAAAPLLTGKWGLIFPFLVSLHWLLVVFKIDFIFYCVLIKL